MTFASFRRGLLGLTLFSLAACGGGNSGTASGSGASASGSSGAGSTAANGLAARVQGGQLVDAQGDALQLRGVNFSGFESVAIQGWDPADPSGGQGGQPGGPDWTAIAGWRANAVRLPLNEASWLGYSCVDTDGVTHNPDPGGNYKAAVQRQVAQANAAGLYVILDLHWSAPGNACPMLQAQMADSDHSLDFWSSVASAYKDHPAVLFELFNEPFFDFEFSGWLANRPSDPQGQMAAAWHAYPTYDSSWGSAANAQPNLSPQIWSEVQAIQAAGFPVVVTETGDQDSSGTSGAPLVANLTAFADQNGVGVIGWTWDVWQNADNVLVTDAAGTPTDGYGQVFHDWTFNHAD